MATTGTITMSMRELDRLKVVQAVVDGNLKPGQAAQRLELTVRQVQRLVKRYQLQGPAGLVSGKHGCRSNHQLSAGLANRALSIIRERYADFGPTLAGEKLLECHGIQMGTEYDKAIYLLADTTYTRGLIGRYIEVYDYPAGRLEIRADGNVLPYVRYNRLPEVDQGAIVENKRLGHVLPRPFTEEISGLNSALAGNSDGERLPCSYTGAYPPKNSPATLEATT